jgi:hypothetical protein
MSHWDMQSKAIVTKAVGRGTSRVSLRPQAAHILPAFPGGFGSKYESSDCLSVNPRIADLEGVT